VTHPWHPITGGITAPQGFLAAGITAGLKASGRPDLSLLLAPESAVCAGTFTTSLVRAACVDLCAERLQARLAAAKILPPAIPVVNNIDVSVETNADRIRDALYRQAFGPVRWVECVQAIKSRGINTLVECGPGKVLAGMVKRIDADMTGLPLFDPASLAEVKGALA
jgi:[acyl-carrier-protein] S-malonyltransferase